MLPVPHFGRQKRSIGFMHRAATQSQYCDALKRRAWSFTQIHVHEAYVSWVGCHLCSGRCGMNQPTRRTRDPSAKQHSKS